MEEFGIRVTVTPCGDLRDDIGRSYTCDVCARKHFRHRYSQLLVRVFNKDGILISEFSVCDPCLGLAPVHAGYDF